MNTRTWNWSAMTLAAFALVAISAAPVWARGGGHGGGGGHRGGGGGHANHHPYHPSQHHAAHHAPHHDPNHPDHHAQANHNHHHNDWHHGNWGPGFWGGAALGYGVGAYAPWGYGGDTYVDNSSDITPVSNDDSDDSDYDSSDDSSYDSSDDSNYDDSSDSSDSADDSSDDSSSAPSTAGDSGFPIDKWPELGIMTYAGEYGGSQGQVVVRIVPGSAAAKAGFVPGDVILSFNGQPVPSAEAFDQILDSANGQFSAEVWDARTGRTSTLSGELGANSAPSSDSTPTAAVSLQ